MKSKKNPKKDMRRWSMIFFQIGLIVVMFLVWRAIENKTYDKVEDTDQQVVQLDHLQEEDMPVTQIPENTPPPPPPPPAPEKIKVVEDDEEVEETEIETPEDIEEPEPVEVSDVQQAPPSDDEPIAEVPFQAIQDVPLFPGCEKFKSNDKRKECMSEKIRKFVYKRFNTNVADDLGITGRNSIYVQFTIDDKGNVVNVKAQNPHRQLKDEAKRVVDMLPGMTPGKQRGKAVKVIYTLPIVFQVN